MTEQPEGRLVKKMINFLNSNYPGWWQKIHGGPFQVRGIPDILGCYEGWFVSIEAKMDYNEASPLQVKQGKAIRKARGIWIVAYSVDDVRKMMEANFE
jgi:hypothetical protein